MAAFSAGKHGVRALSQSLNKEFGKQNIHVAHAIIDGVIKTKIVSPVLMYLDLHSDRDLLVFKD